MKKKSTTEWASMIFPPEQTELQTLLHLYEMQNKGWVIQSAILTKG